MFPKQTTGEYPSQSGWIDSTHAEGLGVHLDVHGAGMPLLPALSRTGSFVHEPFSGTGTTIIACENLKRKCRAIEISPAYVAVAIQRFVDTFQVDPVLLQAGA